MVIWFHKRENIIVKLIRICSICIAIACIMFALQEKVRYPIWLLSLTHAVGLFLLGDKNATVSAPGIITLNAVMFCRYQLVPLSVYMSQRISIFAMNTQYITEAVWLMVCEMLCIFLVLGITGSRCKRRADELQMKPISHLFIPQNKSFIFILMLLVMVAMAMRFPSLVGGLGLITTGGLDVNTREAGYSGIVDMIWRSGLAWIYLYILSKIRDRDSAGKQSAVLIVIATLGYVLFTFILNLGISRWYSLVCVAAALFLIGKIYPQVQRKVHIWTIVPVLVVFLILSVYKNTSFLSGESGRIWNEMAELFDVSILDAYFAGPGCVNNGLNLYNTGKGSILSLPLDTIRNMPLVNHYIDDSYSTVELYASMLHRNDMIIPLSIQSMIYFGFPLFGGLSILAIVLIRKMDEKYLKADDAWVFVYAFVAVWLGLIFVLNYTICVSWFYAYIIPMAVLFAFTTDLKITRGKKA